MIKEQEVELVLNRMYNWKVRSALERAQTIKGFPYEALSVLKNLATRFGNCGWQDGEVYDDLRNGLNIVAAILGYAWSDELDNWIKRDSLQTQTTG